jgi:hypothetical protein
MPERANLRGSRVRPRPIPGQAELRLTVVTAHPEHPCTRHPAPGTRHRSNELRGDHDSEQRKEIPATLELMLPRWTMFAWNGANATVTTDDAEDQIDVGQKRVPVELPGARVCVELVRRSHDRCPEGRMRLKANRGRPTPSDFRRGNRAPGRSSRGLPRRTIGQGFAA